DGADRDRDQVDPGRESEPAGRLCPNRERRGVALQYARRSLRAGQSGQRRSASAPQTSIKAGGAAPVIRQAADQRSDSSASLPVRAERVCQAGAGAGPRQEVVRQAAGDRGAGSQARGRPRAQRAAARVKRCFGAHMMIAGGLHKAITAGQEVGCDVVQVFTKSPQQWKARDLTDEDVSLFQKAQAETGIPCVAAHDTYLINPAAADPAVLERSRAAMIDELGRAARLGIPALVMHLGARGSDPEEAAL